MTYVHRLLLLTALSGLGLFQIATPVRCFAVESKKSVNEVDPLPIPPPFGMWPSAILSLGEESAHALLVDKKNRTLSAWQRVPNGLRLVGFWPVDVGAQEGNKQIAGDRRTPEGIYFFLQTKNGYLTNFDLYGSRIFTLNYPNPLDRRENKSGQGIWLHAIPDSKSLRRGSRGCVVVRNSAIDEIAPLIELRRTPLVITSTAEYLPVEIWQRERKAWLQKFGFDHGNDVQLLRQAGQVVAHHANRILYAETSSLGVKTVFEGPDGEIFNLPTRSEFKRIARPTPRPLLRHLDAVVADNLSHTTRDFLERFHGRDSARF